MIRLTTTLLFLFIFSIGFAQKIEGELQKWHKVTISFDGPEMTENSSENPFLDYRLEVFFTHGNTTHQVPGFFAADGNAAETSADSGTVWKVHFSPDEIGEWSYRASFRKGKAIAVDSNPDAGKAVGFDGANGKFTISESDKTGTDFRAKGRLQYVGERYLQFSGSKEYFVKGGAGSPESLLGYKGFDQTPPTHKYEPHAKDWKSGDPDWQDGKGKNIIGAMNYLASEEMSSVYFLTMSVQGDGNDVWPWNDINERYRFDCSKLDQWEILFGHMDKLGIMLHIFTQETENELLLDIGQTKVQRKLYYRELIARFAHHLGITWNLGEENGPISWSPKGQNDQDRKDAAKYIKETDPYNNHIALHTHSRKPEQEEILRPMLGYEPITGPALQIHHPHEVHEITSKWINESRKAGHIWVTPLDEIGPAQVGAKPDADDPEHNEMRSEVLWGNLMAGGAGVEWYFGYKFAHNDLKCEDWRSRDILWDQTRYALQFFREHLPYPKMKVADGLTDNTEDYVFAENGNVYAIYLPEVKETQLDLTGFDSSYSVKWYNPREGGDLQTGTVKKVKGGTKVSIGFPPNKEKDWVALLKAKKPFSNTASKNGKKGVMLEALKDFKINPTDAASTYYKDENNGALAIDAAKKGLRDKYASANTLFSGQAGLYKMSLVTMTENDGESSYVVKLNGSVIDTITNPTTEKTYSTVNHNLGAYYLEQNDLIQIESKAVTNGRIPENDETAWSRGRWNKLIFNPSGLSMEEELKNSVAFKEADGFIEVEAEGFQYNSANGTQRQWYIRPKEKHIPGKRDSMTDHSDGAGNNLYIEALPDTRVTHDDKLIKGENFFPEAGTGGVVSYKVDFATAGKYYVWVRAFSSGSEDNGVHVGLDGEWPESGARMQWCEGKEQWTWSAAQRTEEVHCGVPQAIYLDIKTAGEHIVSFSMREDGFEMDKWVMTTDKSYQPE